MKKGVAQNDAENDGYIQRFDIVAKVLEADRDGLYNEMELASKVTPKIFTSLVGFDFKKLGPYLLYAMNKVMGTTDKIKEKPTEDEINYINNNAWIQELTRLVTDMNMPIGDLLRLNSYGVVTRNGNQYVVLIDYGLTNQIYDEYYK